MAGRTPYQGEGLGVRPLYSFLVIRSQLSLAHAESAITTRLAKWVGTGGV